VLAEGRTVSEVASDWGVCRQTMHRSLGVATNTGKDMVNLGSTIKNGVIGGATSLWHGIFG
jgi:predicted transcriptional regulator